jgi:anaerobic selenocysteine-containing dehydrogenase
VAETCGISEEDLIKAARWFGESSASLSLYCQGLNQSSSGTAENAAIINLHLATHQIGKPGASRSRQERGGNVRSSMLRGNQDCVDCLH